MSDDPGTRVPVIHSTHVVGSEQGHKAKCRCGWTSGYKVNHSVAEGIGRAHEHVLTRASTPGVIPDRSTK